MPIGCKGGFARAPSRSHRREGASMLSILKKADAATWGLTLLRMVIGWHLLYEGMVKILDSGWTAESYLLESSGKLAPGFRYLAESPTLLPLVNLANEWMLV